MKRRPSMLLAAADLMATGTSATIPPAVAAQAPGNVASAASREAAKNATVKRISAFNYTAPTFIGGRHVSGGRSNRWPFNGKNRAQRQRLNSGFMSM